MRIQEHPILGTYEKGKLVSFTFDGKPLEGYAGEPIAMALKNAGLERYGNEKVRRYSLGMKQRLGIALALLSDPDFVILDEPGNGLDIESTVELRNSIIARAKEKGKTFLVSSHQADDIEKVCDRVIIIYDGALIDDVSVEEALRRSPSLEDYFLMRIRAEKTGTMPGKGGDAIC